MTYRDTSVTNAYEKEDQNQGDAINQLYCRSRTPSLIKKPSMLRGRPPIDVNIRGSLTIVYLAAACSYRQGLEG